MVNPFIFGLPEECFVQPPQLPDIFTGCNINLLVGALSGEEGPRTIVNANDWQMPVAVRCVLDVCDVLCFGQFHSSTATLIDRLKK
jgi:hypothetical protein